MTDTWYNVWNRRNATENWVPSLENLISLDGFDTGAGKIETQDWREYTRKVAEKLEMRSEHSIYEVGCGAGAFLYALREIFDLKVGGNDYSLGLIEAARRALPGFDFKCIEAAEIEVSTRDDYVISNSVFHYLELDYARNVLLKMLQKAIDGVCVLEVPNIDTKKRAEALRRDTLYSQSYNQKYAGLEHTYYGKDRFFNIAQALGMRCEIFDGLMPNYVQNQYRFGVVIWKTTPNLISRS